MIPTLERILLGALALGLGFAAYPFLFHPQHFGDWNAAPGRPFTPPRPLKEPRPRFSLWRACTLPPWYWRLLGVMFMAMAALLGFVSLWSQD